MQRPPLESVGTTRISNKPEAASFKPSAPWRASLTEHAVIQVQRDTVLSVEPGVTYSKSDSASCHITTGVTSAEPATVSYSTAGVAAAEPAATRPSVADVSIAEPSVASHAPRGRTTTPLHLLGGACPVERSSAEISLLLFDVSITISCFAHSPVCSRQAGATIDHADGISEPTGETAVKINPRPRPGQFAAFSALAHVRRGTSPTATSGTVNHAKPVAAHCNTAVASDPPANSLSLASTSRKTTSAFPDPAAALSEHAKIILNTPVDKVTVPAAVRYNAASVAIVEPAVVFDDTGISGIEPGTSPIQRALARHKKDNVFSVLTHRSSDRLAAVAADSRSALGVANSGGMQAHRLSPPTNDTTPARAPVVNDVTSTSTSTTARGASTRTTAAPRPSPCAIASAPTAIAIGICPTGTSTDAAIASAAGAVTAGATAAGVAVVGATTAGAVRAIAAIAGRHASTAGPGAAAGLFRPTASAATGHYDSSAGATDADGAAGGTTRSVTTEVATARAAAAAAGVSTTSAVAAAAGATAAGAAASTAVTAGADTAGSTRAAAAGARATAAAARATAAAARATAAAARATTAAARAAVAAASATAAAAGATAAGTTGAPYARTFSFNVLLQSASRPRDGEMMTRPYRSRLLRPLLRPTLTTASPAAPSAANAPFAAYATPVAPFLQQAANLIAKVFHPATCSSVIEGRAGSRRDKWAEMSGQWALESRLSQCSSRCCPWRLGWL
jgi:hypothetical protein